MSTTLRNQPKPRRPVALASLSPDHLRNVFGVMTDIDDTITRDGQLDPAARVAMRALMDAGVPLMAITGRPMGWSRDFMLQGIDAWPVNTIVAENGAVALLREFDRSGAGNADDAVTVEFAQDEPTRQANTVRLQATLARIEREVSGAQRARDSAGRVTDIAIDHSEFTRLPAAAIAQVVALMREEGMTATVSSIHINGWYGAHDKLSGARWMVQRLFGRELNNEMTRWVYVGDSTNDQTMFGAFALSVGVANVMHFDQQMHTWPAFITQGERGAGFAEVAAALLGARRCG